MFADPLPFFEHDVEELDAALRRQEPGAESRPATVAKILSDGALVQSRRRMIPFRGRHPERLWDRARKKRLLRDARWSSDGLRTIMSRASGLPPPVESVEIDGVVLRASPQCA